MARRVGKDLRQPVKRLGQAVGELVWASNSAHSSISVLFTFLVNPNDGKPGMAMWHVLRSDKAQRDITVAVTTATLRRTSHLCKGILWAIGKLNSLSELRNDIVHMDVRFDTQTRPHLARFHPISSPPSRADRLQRERNLVKTLRVATGDILALGEYVFGLHLHRANPKDWPLPRRPRLRWVRAKDRGNAPYPHPIV
jgi:hypothetical protein